MRFALIWRDGEPTLNPKKTEEAAESFHKKDQTDTDSI